MESVLSLWHLEHHENKRFNSAKQEVEDGRSILAHLERRALDGKFVPIGELRDVLRRAATLLWRTNKDQCAIVQHLVGIPFSMLTKQSIKLGISLWLGVINENPRMEPRIVAVIAENWERTVRHRFGVFSSKLQYSRRNSSSDILTNELIDTWTLFMSKKNLPPLRSLS